MVRYKSRRLVYGVGINDANYVTQPKDRSLRCPYYDVWHSMLRRCYSQNSKIINKSYVGVVVADNWLRFSNFKAWMEQQHWKGNVLDKDFLGNGKLYSEQSCVFIPNYLNSSITTASSKRAGKYPLGVVMKPRLKSNPYAAQATGAEGKRIHLGTRATPIEAHKLWQEWRLSSLQEVREKYARENSHVITVLSKIDEICDRLKQDIENNLETLSIMEI